MNSLSWLIYWIGVVDNIRWVMGATMIISTIALVCWVFVGFCGADDGAPSKNFWRGWRKSGITFAAIGCVSVFVSSFAPSRQTLLLIAGSQIGEKVVQSDAVQSVVDPGMNLLKTWIKSETDKLTKEAK